MWEQPEREITPCLWLWKLIGCIEKWNYESFMITLLYSIFMLVNSLKLTPPMNVDYGLKLNRLNLGIFCFYFIIYLLLLSLHLVCLLIFIWSHQTSIREPSSMIDLCTWDGFFEIWCEKVEWSKHFQSVAYQDEGLVMKTRVGESLGGEGIG